MTLSGEAHCPTVAMNSMLPFQIVEYLTCINEPDGNQTTIDAPPCTPAISLRANDSCIHLLPRHMLSNTAKLEP